MSIHLSDVDCDGKVRDLYSWKTTPHVDHVGIFEVCCCERFH